MRFSMAMRYNASSGDSSEEEGLAEPPQYEFHDLDDSIFNPMELNSRSKLVN